MKAVIKSGCARIHERIHSEFTRMVPKSSEGGTFTFARSSVASPTTIRYICSTGIRNYDDLVGGMPFGKASELVGLPQSGKSTMAVRILVRAQEGYVYERIQTPNGGIKLQKLKPGTFQVTTLYYDEEGSLSDFDKRLCDGILLDAEILQCDTVELLWATMDKVMTILDEEQKDTGILQFLLVAIDTVGSLSTKSEYVRAWGKVDFPRVPQELKTGFKVMVGRMQRENVLLLGLNHVSRRMDMRTKKGFRAWEYSSPGGKAFSYFAYHRIFFEMKEVRYSLAGSGNQDGFLVFFQTLKNRLAPPLRASHMSLLFTLKDPETGKLIREGGFFDINCMLEALIFAKAARVAKQTGSISLRFNAFGVTTTTFGKAPSAETTEKTESLEEQEEAPEEEAESRRSKRDPKIPNRAAWPEFYAQHKADCEALYLVVIRQAHSASKAPVAGQDDDTEETETLD